MTNAVNIAQGGTNNVSWRNRIINGAMVIDQRNSGASVTGNSGVYPVDRWQTYATQSSKLTCQRSTTAPTGFVNSIIYTSSSAYSVLAGDYFSTTQRIEGFNVADLMYGTASAVTTTLSFWVRSSLTGTFGGACHNNAFNRVYPFSYTVSSANTWEFKTVQIVGDTTGTWTTDNSVGLEIGFSLGCGSTGLGTAGAWAGTSNIFGATGQVNLVGTSGATFYITGVQLEAGTAASPFEFRNYGQELFMCQRYCEAIFLTGSGADRDLGMGAGNGGSGAFQAFVTWKVQKRTAPTVALAGASNFYVHVPGAFRATCSSVSAVDATEFGSHFQGVSSTGTLNTGQACFFAAVPSTAVITASAEL